MLAPHPNERHNPSDGALAITDRLTRHLARRDGMTTIRTRIPRLVVMLWGMALTAPAAAQTTRDSAGVRIVDNVAPVWRAGRGWRLSEQPMLAIGGRPGAGDTLGRIVGATRLSDGRIVVADGTANQLRFYDATGRPLASVGPGELRGIRAIARLQGDTLAVDGLRGTTLVAPDGQLVRTVQFGPFPPGALQTPVAMALGRFADGAAVVADYPQGARRPAGAQRWVDSSSLFLVDRGGAVVRPLGTAPVVVLIAGRSHPSPMDLGPQAVYASSGHTMYLGFSDRYAIGVYDRDFRLQRIVRRAWTPRPLTAPEIDAYVDGWMQLWSKATGAERTAERAEMRGQAYPDSLPAYGALLATPSGELWVRAPDLTGAPGCWCLAGLSTVPSPWSVFDAGGRWLGEVAMPARFIPLEIGADYVLGRARDTDGVARVVMHRLEKPR